MSISADTPIEYRFLSMDQRRFMLEQELVQQYRSGGLTRAMHDWKGKALIAYGHAAYTEEEAIALAKRIGFDIRSSNSS